MYSLCGLFFFIDENPYLAFCTDFSAKTCFSIHIKQSSVNFTWFALLSHQKFDDRPLFMPGEL